MSGSVKYFVEMLMEAEAHQQPSLKQHRMKLLVDADCA